MSSESEGIKDLESVLHPVALCLLCGDGDAMSVCVSPLAAYMTHTDEAPTDCDPHIHPIDPEALGSALSALLLCSDTPGLEAALATLSGLYGCPCDTDTDTDTGDHPMGTGDHLSLPLSMLRLMLHIRPVLSGLLSLLLSLMGETGEPDIQALVTQWVSSVGGCWADTQTAVQGLKAPPVSEIQTHFERASHLLGLCVESLNETMLSIHTDVVQGAHAEAEREGERKTLRDLSARSLIQCQSLRFEPSAFCPSLHTPNGGLGVHFSG
ncbi:hypothetical protein KIPB_005284, partial [Kipferlia bialata]